MVWGPECWGSVILMGPFQLKLFCAAYINVYSFSAHLLYHAEASKIQGWGLGGFVGLFVFHCLFVFFCKAASN